MRVINVTISDKGQIHNVDFVAWIMNEIEGKEFTRKDVALTYAILLQKNTQIETLVEVNKAIIKRWSPSGFKWIKEQAWKIVNKEIGAC